MNDLDHEATINRRLESSARAEAQAALSILLSDGWCMIAGRVFTFDGDPPESVVGPLRAAAGEDEDGG